ncbi:MAG: hypothetical protein ACRD2J_14540 [Thermoanaerobaculia bacterium]
MTPIPPHEFALARAEERWIVEGGEPRLLELRAESGHAIVTEADGIVRIDARSRAYFPTSSSYGGADDRLFAAILDALPPARRFHVRRLLLTRSVTAMDGTTFEQAERLVTIRGGAAGIVLRLDGHAADVVFDLADLLASPQPDARPAPWREVPLAWLRGSAAILFHEAIGHPAEVGAAPVSWPRWLRVFDDPAHDGLGAMARDDTGRAAAAADLTAGETPHAWRREGYRDLPLRRMTNVVVRAENSGALPLPRIEIDILGGGRWDPLTDLVEIRVAAARLVESEGATPLLPFTWRARRAAIPALLAGAAGEPASYPGVLCSHEGQRIAVGSWAPVVVTREPAE